MYQLHNVIFILFPFILFSSFYGQKNTPKLSGPYLGQKPPGMTSELFAPGILSTEANEFNATFTLSIDAVYFTGRGKDGQDIMVIKYKEGIWQNRKLASFSSPFRDVDPFITPDGKKLFFSSNRPIEGDEAEEDCDFWYVVKRMVMFISASLMMMEPVIFIISFRHLKIKHQSNSIILSTPNITSTIRLSHLTEVI